MTLDREDVEAVAARVAELLNEPMTRVASGMVDAATAARLLGVSRATVYARADELGAIRVGDGKRARLRFDPVELLRADGRDDRADTGPTAGRHRRRSQQRAGTELLSIRGGRSGGRGALGS